MNSAELLERLLDFAANVGKLVDELPETRLGKHVAGQLVRSGTAALPNYAEACAAESRADFIHKLRICLKELRESEAWLRLISRAALQIEMNLTILINEVQELASIIAQSIITARQNATRGSKPKN